MNEIGDAVQIVEVPFHVLGSVVNLIIETSKFGAMIVKALMKASEEHKRKMLSGEVSMDQLTRLEGNNLSVARFENITMDELKPILEQYAIPYAEMPASEVNGTDYVSVTFANTYKDRMNAVIQHFEGKGEIINDTSTPKYINSGEVSLQLLMEQEGPSLMAYQFPEEHKEQIINALNQAGIKFAVLPDLNLNDGMAEVAYPASRQNIMASVVERIKKGKIITPEQYMKNADPETVKEKAESFDKDKDWMETAKNKVYEMMNEKHLVLANPVDASYRKVRYRDYRNGLTNRSFFILPPIHFRELYMGPALVHLWEFTITTPERTGDLP